MKITHILKKILLILMLFVFLSVNFTYSFAKNEFYYSGTQKGTYQAKATFFATITKMLADLADYIIGLATLGHRMFLVGYTSIAELILNDTLEAAAGDDQPFKLNAATLDMTDSNNQRKVTVENIVFNKIPLLDINFFNTEIDDTVTGTGAVKERLEEENKNGKVEATNDGTKITSTGISLNEDEELPEGAVDPATANESVITIIKNAIAKWYYAMRSLAIGAMLIILLYIALRLIVATVGEQKAKYKQMLYNWVVGFAVVFCIHYVMLFVIMVNEELVAIFNQMSIEYVEKDYKSAADKTNTEMELSLYSSLRSRAYELKASRGWVGTILYMVLVYYAIRYTLVYLKRYFTVMILAMLAPIMSATYAFGKVRTGKAESFNKWVKEFVFAVLLQSVHAMTYVTLITQLLKLTESSLAGVVLSFLILNFMLKTDAIIKRIFNMSTGQHGALDNILGAPGAVAEAWAGIRSAKHIASAYKNYWLKPVYGGMVKGIGAGLSIPGNALLGATGGALTYYSDNRAVNRAAVGAALGKDGTQSNSTTPRYKLGNEPPVPGAKKGPGGIWVDKDGKPINLPNNENGMYPHVNVGKGGFRGFMDTLNPSKYTDEQKAEFERKNQGKSKEERDKAKKSRDNKWAERGALMKDKLRDRAVTSLEKTLQRKGYFDANKMSNPLDAQIEKKLESIKKNRKKDYKEQRKMLYSAIGGIGLKTFAIPMMIANPKIGISLFAKGYIMEQQVAKYDKKGLIAKKSLRLQRVEVEKVNKETGEIEKKVKYKPVGFMTSAGTFVKKATGIAYFEGLSTNIEDSIDKSVKRTNKELKELEILYETREKLNELQILKDKMEYDHKAILENPQQAIRKENMQKGLQDGSVSIYAGRVMETNPLIKKFMEDNGITTPEQIVAMNALLKTAVETSPKDISKININKYGMYTKAMNNALEEMHIMGIDTISEEDAKKLTNLGIKIEEAKEQRIAEVDAMMFAIKDVMDKNPKQAHELIKAFAIQEATAAALNEKEDKITHEIRESGIMHVAKEQKEIQKDMKTLKEEESMLKRFEAITNPTDEDKERRKNAEEKVEELKNKIKDSQTELDKKIEETVIEVLGNNNVIDKEKYIEDKKECVKLENEIADLKDKIEKNEKNNNTEDKIPETELARMKNELEEKEKALEDKNTEMTEVKEIIENAIIDTEAMALGGKTKVEILEVSTDEIMESLGKNGQYETILQLERTEKPQECKKIENVLFDIGNGEVTGIPLEKEDEVARANAIKDLVNEIKVDNLGNDVKIEAEKYEVTKTIIDETTSNTDEKIDNAPEKAPEKTPEEIRAEKREKAFEFAETVSQKLEDEKKKDTIEEITKQIEETVEKTVSKAAVENELAEQAYEGKDLANMSDEVLREVYRETTEDTNNYLEYVSPKKQDEVTLLELDIAKNRIKEKLNLPGISEKDKSQLSSLLKKFDTDKPMSTEDYNRIVRQVNGVNAVAEEAFIKEFRNEESASNVPHNEDHVTTTADRVRRSLNSDAVRESKAPQTEIQSLIADLLRVNDYATYEVIEAKSSGYAGKKYEKGPIINLSSLIKNLD